MRAALVMALLVGGAWPAQGHSSGDMTYPLRCCFGTPQHGDCGPIEGVNQVEHRANGWFIKQTGETIPFDKTEPSQDLRFHRCKKPDNTTRCFFAPGSGT